MSYACTCRTDEGFLERGRRDAEDALLVAGHGRLAPAAHRAAAQVAAHGHRPGRAQRDRPGNTRAQHAHTHVRVLSQSVSRSV